MSVEGLMACPWCGGDILTMVREKLAFLACETCVAEGPVADTPDGARKAWNRRALPTREELARTLRDAAMGDNTEAGFLTRADAVLALLGRAEP